LEIGEFTKEGLFVQMQDYGMLEEKVKSVVENYPEFHLTEGKMVR
jgi:hypothetical protein